MSYEMMKTMSDLDDLMRERESAANDAAAACIEAMHAMINQDVNALALKRISSDLVQVWRRAKSRYDAAYARENRRER
jgi:hypothetical protein